MPYIRIGKYPIHVIHHTVKDFRNGFKPELYRFNGYKIHLGSDRYHMFIKKGIKCVSCGLRGSYYALERLVNHKVYQQFLKREFDDFLKWERQYQKSLKKKPIFFQSLDTYHFNLYAIDDNGNEVLMTKDHIIPKSKGGKNHLSNYQPMCYICNKEKDNKIERR